MNDNKGKSPFAGMGLTGTDDKKVDSLINNLTSAIDHSAINKDTLPVKNEVKPRAKARQIYFSADVDLMLTQLKKEQRLNVSAFVDKAVRDALAEL